jgi:hypothetical protein
MKDFKKAQKTKAQLPESEKTIGGNVGKEFNNDTKSFFKKEFRRKDKNGK